MKINQETINYVIHELESLKKEKDSRVVIPTINHLIDTLKGGNPLLSKVIIL